MNKIRHPSVSSHPSLKACGCGFIGSKTGLYNHIDHELTRSKERGEPSKDFWLLHGEVPLNVDDPRITVEKVLESSLTREQKLELL